MDVASALAGGDRRSIGRANEVASFVLAHAEHLPDLIDGLGHADPVIRMRCADAAVKVAAAESDWLVPFAGTLVAIAGTTTQQEVRWHLAQILPRLPLSPAERAAAVSVLFRYLDDDSRIVRVCAMTALWTLSGTDPGLRRKVAPRVRRFAEAGSPAERSRARKLLRG